MRKPSINPFSVQNVVYHLLLGNSSMTTLKLNVMLHIINLQFKSAFGDLLWNVSEFYEAKGIQRSIWVDLRFGFMPETELFGVEMFNAQSDSRHCKLPNSLNGIVQMVRAIYKNLDNNELMSACIFSSIPLRVPAENFNGEALISEFKRYDEKIFFVAYNVDTMEKLIKG